MPFEDELSQELRRTGETFEMTGRAAVVDGALDRGRRSLRRRRSAAVAGSVLALALIGGGGAFGAGLLSSGPGDGTGVAGSGPATSSATPSAEAEAESDAEPDAGPDAEPSTGPSAKSSTEPDAKPGPENTPRTDKDAARAGEGSPDPSRRQPKRSQEPPLDYALVMPTFLKLLPKGLSVEEKDNQEQYASVVVDDGKGRTLVQINVQPDMRDVADHLYGDATTLPDGTLLATSKGPGEKGGAGVVVWTADTMRPDGLRVVVSAFNSGEQSTPATRPEPAITLEQLTTLATSPEWLKVQP
ncbi:hypothetical protein [Streptomyces sp. cmx-18-6]|uniref:hypothetical protein n=1 Tax=Streptomyces sp. cmx-18-6 TaxID=2790930 RepID=UPI00397F2871